MFILIGEFKKKHIKLITLLYVVNTMIASTHHLHHLQHSKCITPHVNKHRTTNAFISRVALQKKDRLSIGCANHGCINHGCINSGCINRRSNVISKVGSRDGGALLERNVIININISFEPFYRVILYYSNWDDDKATALKITNAISIIDFNAAMKVVQNAKGYGKAIVVTVIKDDAVLYMNNLKNKGLEVSIDEA